MSYKKKKWTLSYAYQYKTFHNKVLSVLGTNCNYIPKNSLRISLVGYDIPHNDLTKN